MEHEENWSWTKKKNLRLFFSFFFSFLSFLLIECGKKLSGRMPEWSFFLSPTSEYWLLSLCIVFLFISKRWRGLVTIAILQHLLWRTLITSLVWIGLNHWEHFDVNFKKSTMMILKSFTLVDRDKKMNIR